MPDDTIWSKRLNTSQRYYEKYENLFKCKELEKYYEGFHWRNVPDNYRPYTVNEFYTIIMVKTANYLLSRPKFVITPEPSFGQFDLEQAIQGAQQKEDILNTIVKRRASQFKRQLWLAFLDSMFRYGIVETGYSSDWIHNPNANKPLLKSHTKENVDRRKDKVVREPDDLPTNERIYFKRIRASRFRLGGIDGDDLDSCNWYGYYDFAYKSDILSMKELKNLDDIKSASPSVSDDYDSTLDQENDTLKGGDVVKIWHIWDNRAKERLLLLDSPNTTLWRGFFSRRSIFDLRWNLRTFGWYPIPPSFQWVSPQDEINESREQLRNFRRRFTRKFQAIEGTVDEEEKSKFEHGPESAIISVKKENAITPIQNPDISSSVRDAFLVSADDINKVSGTSSEMRGQADRTTATQARLIDIRSTTRENWEQSHITEWICNIVRESLHLFKDKFVHGMWAESTIPDNFLGEVSVPNTQYNYVLPEELDSYDYTIAIDVVSTSPMKAEEEKQHFLEFMSVVNNFPQISLSPDLIREAAYRCGYRNEKVIKEMQKMALIVMLGQQQQAQAGAGGQKAQQIVEQQTPNTQPEIENQLGKQLLVQ